MSRDAPSGEGGGLPEGTTEEQFNGSVFPEELAYIRERRATVLQQASDEDSADAEEDGDALDTAAGLAGEAMAGDRRAESSAEERGPDGPLAEDGARDRPSTGHGLVGLAFSGGGIRSATFNLGVLQALRERGVFKHIDLMSTVSGGGFIGSCLTSLLSRGESFPFEGESTAVVHLRNNSNYLAPSGPLDYLRMFAVLIRGIILNLLVLVPFLMVPCLLATLFFGPQLLTRLRYDEDVQLARRLLTAAVRADKIEIAEGEPVAPLLDSLRRRGFLPLAIANQESRITDELGRENLEARDVRKALIAGTGSQDARYTFLDNVGIEEIAHRLVDARLIVPPKSIQEVRAIEMALRKELRRRLIAGGAAAAGQAPGLSPTPPSTATGSSEAPRYEPFPEPVSYVVQSKSLRLRKGPTDGDPIVVDLLRDESVLARGVSGDWFYVSTRRWGKGWVSKKFLKRDKDPAKQAAEFVKFLIENHVPKRGESAAGKLFMVFVEPKTLREVLNAADKEGWRSSYSHTQILQLFYDQHLFDPQTVATMFKRPHREAEYRWPSAAPSHLEIEAAARELWKGLPPPPEAVEAPGQARLVAARTPPPKREPSPGKALPEAPPKTLESRPGVTTAPPPAPPKALPQAPPKASTKAPPKGVGAKPDPLASGLEEAEAPLLKQGIAVRPVAAESRRKNEFQVFFEALVGLSQKQESEDGQEKGLLIEIEESGFVRGKAGRVAFRSPEDTSGSSERERLFSSLTAAGLVVPIDPKKSGSSKAAGSAGCEIDNLSGCRFVNNRSFMQLPRHLYKRGFYRQEWFDDHLASDEEDEVDPVRKLLHAIPVVRDWFDPPRRRLYEPREISQDLSLIAAAEEAMALADAAPSGVPAVIDRLVALSQRQPGRTPLLRPSWRSPGDRETLSQRLRAALESEDLIDCQGRGLGTCVFASAAVREIPYLLDENHFYNPAWQERLVEITKRRKELIGRLKGKAPTVSAKELASFLGETRAELVELAGGEAELAVDLFGKLRAGELLASASIPFVDCAATYGRKDDVTGGAGIGGKVALQAAQCPFELDGAVEWLYDHDYIGPAATAGGLAVRWSRLREKARGWYERHVSDSLESSRWNPRELRLPVTVLAVLAGLAWVLLFPLISLVRSLRRKGSHQRDRSDRSFGVFMLLIAGVAFLELQPYLVYHWYGLQLGWDRSVILGALSIVTMVAAGPALTLFKKFGKVIVLLVLAVVGPLLPFVMYLSLLSQVIYSDWPTRSGYQLDYGYVWFVFLFGALVVHLFLLLVDPNITGMHNFYKGRLGRAYLLARGQRHEIEGGRDLGLGQMCPPDSGAPFHLLNSALNIQGGGDPSVRDRHSDFFTVSKLFVGGGKRTGYCRTDNLQEVWPRMSLGTAMAASGAAAAPNMGSYTVGPLVILLSLLNVRLGYWMPNPRAVRQWLRETATTSRAWRLVKYLPARMLGLYRVRPGPYVFLRELLSRTDDEGSSINISDGGHIENTGIYELLRRRCKLIIACDAEADPKMNLTGLAALQRLARIDLNVEISINTARLQRARGHSRDGAYSSQGRRSSDPSESERQESAGGRHFAVGRIRYRPRSRDDAAAETGYLIYLKSSLTGDESQIVSEYNARKPLFPHESTGDQFFDENQFEAYRELGSHVVHSFRDELESARPEEGKPDPAGSKRELGRERAVLKLIDGLEWKQRDPQAETKRTRAQGRRAGA